MRVSILRIPGIYAPDREGGTPRARLLRGTAVLQPEDDVYTNHIHAEDLARACLKALWRGRPQRIYHASDDSQLKMGTTLTWRPISMACPGLHAFRVSRRLPNCLPRC